MDLADRIGRAGRAPRTGRAGPYCAGLAVLAGLGRLTVLPGLAELRRCPNWVACEPKSGCP
ncbi:hypothetical protein I545_6877 [Mycobacterium kansasii 662]|uniref:Uncharacterized protein n=1 Tax=Mycobacterium kansasii 662 TaxID=1299326 RepID=X7XPK4_MYCKA|nr:hypothetical protein I545_6877 [Mycobacterium kansasii 662]